MSLCELFSFIGLNIETAPIEVAAFLRTKAPCAETKQQGAEEGDQYYCRGIRAKRSLSQGEVIFKILPERFLNAENALKHMPALHNALLALDQQRKPSSSIILNEEFVMCCFLIFSRFGHFQSIFSNYIALLPSTEELGSPYLLFMAAESQPNERVLKERIRNAFGSSLRYQKALRQWSKAQTNFREFNCEYFLPQRGFFDADLFSLENWLWAKHIVSSRSYSYTSSDDSAYPEQFLSTEMRELYLKQKREKERGDVTEAPALEMVQQPSKDKDVKEEDEEEEEEDSKQRITLLPLMDLLNHSFAKTMDFTFKSNPHEFTLTCDRDYREGEELLIRYNTKGHWAFAKRYGFVPQFQNPEDRFPMKVPEPQPASLAMGSSTLKLAIAQLFTCKERVAKLLYLTRAGPSLRLLGSLRVRFMSETDLAVSHNAYSEMLSVRNEWHAFRHLMHSIQLNLSEIEESKRKDGDRRCSLENQLVEWALKVACDVRAHDEDILRAALTKVKERFLQLSEIQYYGASTEDLVRTNIIQRQFDELRARQQQKLPLSAVGSGSRRLQGFPLLPSFDVERDGSANAWEAAHEVTTKMQRWRERTAEALEKSILEQ